MPSGRYTEASVSILIIEMLPEHVSHVQDSIAAHWGEAANVVHCVSGRLALSRLRVEKFDVILADIESVKDLGPKLNDGFSRIAQSAGGALLIALSSGHSVSTAVAAMQAGAHDFMARPIAGAVLASRLEELGQRHGKARAIACDSGKATIKDFEGFVGTSPQMQAIYEQIKRIAPSSAPVFITGESGTGKEISAEAIHKRSERAEKPFVAIHTSAIPKDQLEAELFGSAIEAFSGTSKEHKGALERADGGSLFLDEIGDIDLSLQAKLLRFLQTKTITRVGESQPREIDVRLICATSRNPMQLVSEKKFREDLFYRLHVLPIHLPPLRQRPTDIMPLAISCLAQFSKEEKKSFKSFDSDVADLLVGREWPGNVSQLQNIIRRIVVMFDGSTVNLEMANAADIESRSAEISLNITPETHAQVVIQPMWQQEQRIIEEALDLFGGSIARAAAALEISPSTIYRKKLNWDKDGKWAGVA